MNVCCLYPTIILIIFVAITASCTEILIPISCMDSCIYIKYFAVSLITIKILALSTSINISPSNNRKVNVDGEKNKDPNGEREKIMK